MLRTEARPGLGRATAAELHILHPTQKATGGATPAALLTTPEATEPGLRNGFYFVPWEF